jgi:hypothetical protein
MEDIFSFIVCVCARSLYSDFPIIFAHQKAVCILFPFSLRTFINIVICASNLVPLYHMALGTKSVSAVPMASNKLQADVYDRKSDKL